MRKVTGLIVVISIAVLIQTVFPDTVQAIYSEFAGTFRTVAARDEKRLTATDSDTKKPGFPHVNFDEARDAVANVEKITGGSAVAGASSDFDSDGVQDLVTSDANGKLRYFKGNADSIYPNSPEAKVRRKQFGEAAPFSASDLDHFLPFRPQFFAAGDFNADGYSDILAAAQGGDSMVLMAGNGKGGFSEPQTIGVGGRITSMITGEIGRIDGQTDVAVAIQSNKGSFLLVYEHPEGAFRHAPESFGLASAATSLAVGQLDNDPYADIAAACVNDLTVVHGRGQAYPLDLKADLDIQRPAAKIQTRRLPFRAAAIVIGNFDNERRNSLAILTENGSVTLLKSTQKIVSQRRIAPNDLNKVINTAFTPSGADARHFTAVKNDQITDQKQAEKSGLLMMDTDKQKDGLLKYMAEKSRTDNENFSKLPSDERSRILVEKAAKSFETRQRRKEVFEQDLAGQPSDLNRFEFETISTDNRLANATVMGAKSLIAARVSDSDYDDLIVADQVSKQIHIIYQTGSNAGRSKGQRQKAEIVSLESETTPTSIVPMRLNSDALNDLVILGEGSATPSIRKSLAGQIFVVNTTDNDSGGNCDGTDPCSLRRAILIANQTPGADEIDFNIPGGGVQTIHPLSSLPDITGPVVIDGTTQPGFAGTPLIEIEGDLLSGAGEGLKIRASSSVVRGLNIDHIPSAEINASQIGGSGITVLSTSGSPNVSHVIIEGNFLGTDPTGEFKKGNDANGVHIFDADNNTVGGTIAQARNILSGNGKYSEQKRGVGLAITGGNDNLIEGNYIGADASGVVKLGNSYGVFLTGMNNQFGGDAAGAGNVVSGNGDLPNQFNQCNGGGIAVIALVSDTDGALLTDSNNFKGNLIGTIANGEGPLGNCTVGISSNVDVNTTIGSITDGGRNVISDNGWDAIWAAHSALPNDPQGGGTIIVGNNIGTDKAGNTAIANDQRNNGCVGFCTVTDTVWVSPSDMDIVIVGSPGGTTPGGACTGLCNLISGNDHIGNFGGGGLYRTGFGMVLTVNNYFGTNRAGNAALPNRRGGNSYYGSIIFGAEFSDGNGGSVDGGNLAAGNTGAGLGLSAKEVGGIYQISGNLVGMSSDGNDPLPNGISNSGGAGVFVSSDAGTEVIVGGTGQMQKNVIGATTDNGFAGGDGISLSTNGTTRVLNNWVGLNKAGNLLPNTGNGISASGTGRTFIGGTGPNDGNVIIGNAKAGVLVVQYTGSFSTTLARNISIRGNGIAINGGLGIDLSNITGGPGTGNGVTPNDCLDTDKGANGLQNFPELYAPDPAPNGAISVDTELRSSPSQPYTIDFYESTLSDPSNYGEGANYIGSTNVVTDGNGYVSFTFVSPYPVELSAKITATATDAGGNTSEFSCFAGQCTTGARKGEKGYAPQVGCGQPIIVTIDTDEPDANTADGVCDVDTNITGLQCSLRAAIQEANARAGYDAVDFDIPGGGIHTIAPVTDLPVVTQEVIIDGTTQSGYAGSPLIEIRGDAASAQTGLKVQTDNSRIYGLTINRFPLAGIQIIGNDSKVDRCYIGINADGLTMDLTRRQAAGILLKDVTSQNNMIGSDFGGNGNVIGNNQSGVWLSGENVKNNIVKNNNIGTNKDGTGALANDIGIILSGGTSANLIGGILDEDTNVISGNTQAGIDITAVSKQNRISGNLIGTNGEGNGPLGNTQYGIVIAGGSSDNTIGGGTSERNIISGQSVNNQGSGIVFADGAGQNTVAGNYIGTNKAGNAAVANYWGISILNTSQNVSGTANAPNIISGNVIGLVLGVDTNQSINNVTVSYNLIGTDSTGNQALHNGTGMVFLNTVTNSVVSHNTISGNLNYGILMGSLEIGSSNCTISENKIGTNSQGNAPIPNKIGVLLLDSNTNTIQKNTISGNLEYGVELGAGGSSARMEPELKELLGRVPDGTVVPPTQNNKIQGNMIGVSAGGTFGIPNGKVGVFLAAQANNNMIGGRRSSFEGNVISGNDLGAIGYGISVGTFNAPEVVSDHPTGNRIQGNRIGIKGSTYTALGNNIGIKVRSGNNTLIGGDPDTCIPGEQCDLSDFANTIGGNTQQGILLEGPDASSNRIVSNFIGVAPDGTAIGNGADGIWLDRAVDSTIQDNTVSGNGANGIQVQGDSLPPPQTGRQRSKNRPALFNTKILGNVVGGMKIGETFSKIPNALAGIMLNNASGVSVGNGILGSLKTILIGNDGPGVLIEGENATGNKINNCVIGTDEDGTAGLGNGGDGVKLLNAPDNIVGDDIPGGGRANTIAGNTGNGVAIEGAGAHHNSILGNVVGVVNRSGLFKKLGNLENGVKISDAFSNVLGGVQPSFGNTISGNGLNGVFVSGSQSIGNVIKQNLIGSVDSLGSTGFGNLFNGVLMNLGASQNTIGGDEPNAANTISDNGGNGVWIDDGTVGARKTRPAGVPVSQGNDVRRNNIFRNGGLGIDIGAPGVNDNDSDDPDEGANRGQNYPEVSNVRIDGNGDLLLNYLVDTDPANANYGTLGINVEFYKSDALGQGQAYLAFDRWTVGDHNSITAKQFNLGNAAALGFTASDFITATATDADNNTSEFVPVNLANCPDVSTPVLDSHGSDAGVTVTIPVNTTNLTGLGVLAADFTFDYDPAVLSPLPADITVTAGTVSPGATVNINTSVSGSVIVSVFNTSEFTGAGTVVDLHFKVVGPNGSFTALTLNNFRYNNNLVCSDKTSGMLTVVSGTVTGKVTLENEGFPLPAAEPVPVPNAKVEATAQSSSFWNLSNTSGDYVLSGFGTEPFTIAPSKTDVSSMAPNGIFSNDASLVAQYVVNLITLNPAQQRAANVSGLGSVSSLDAALIAQWIVGIPNPINQTGKWKFTPPSTTPDVRVDSTQNYLALLMGDVDGSWDPAGPNPARNAVPIDPANTVRVSMPNLSAASGSSVTIPLRVDNLRGRAVTAYQFVIEYDPAVISAAQISADLAGPLGERLSVVSNSSQPGLLRVAVYGSLPVTGDGVYADLHFTVIGGTGSATPLVIRGFVLNGNSSDVIVTSGTLSVGQ